MALSILVIYSIILVDMGGCQHPKCHEIYNFVRPFLDHHYYMYILSLPDPIILAAKYNIPDFFLVWFTLEFLDFHHLRTF